MTWAGSCVPTPFCVLYGQAIAMYRLLLVCIFRSDVCCRQSAAYPFVSCPCAALPNPRGDILHFQNAEKYKCKGYNIVMHTNSGLSDTASSEAVQNATLDAFHQIRKDAVVIDDDMTLEDYAASYMKACPSNEVACFFDCTNVLNQYKTWNKALPEVQPFYGTRTAFV